MTTFRKFTSQTCQIYTLYKQFAAVKCVSMQVCCLSPSTVSPNPSPKKLFRSVRIPWSTLVLNCVTQLLCVCVLQFWRVHFCSFLLNSLPVLFLLLLFLLFYRASAQLQALYQLRSGCPSVCLSVCHTLALSEKDASQDHEIFTDGQPKDSSFRDKKFIQKFERGHPERGR